jgi:ethanolamine ammonia-lyase small subunit
MSDEPERLPQDASETRDLWQDLRRLTAARIGLPRSGASLATGPLLEFQLAHARARDAVHAELDEAKLIADCHGLGLPIIAVGSAASDRPRYLMRPDLGRRLTPDAEATFEPHASGYDVAFVVSGGLSAQAVQMHATPVLANAVADLLLDAVEQPGGSARVELTGQTRCVFTIAQ